MNCPLRVIANCTLQNEGDIDTECIRTTCAWWNDYFGMCGMAVPAFLNAREEERIRTEEAERKAYHEGGFNER